MEGLKIADYQLLKHKSMLNQNIVTEDDQGNVVEMPARAVFTKLYQEKLSVCIIED